MWQRPVKKKNKWPEFIIWMVIITAMVVAGFVCRGVI